MLKLWLVTCPDDFSAEYEDVEEMFRRGLTRLILDKRRNSVDDYERWLLSLSEEYRERIWVRGTPDVAEHLDVRGCVCEARSVMGEVPESWKRVNCIALCRNPEEYLSLPDWVSGALMGPLYQPMSALEPVATLDVSLLEKAASDRTGSMPIIAWGGVEPETLPEIRKHPVSGVACLGGIWNYADPINAFIKMQRAVTGFGGV